MRAFKRLFLALWLLLAAIPLRTGAITSASPVQVPENPKSARWGDLLSLSGEHLFVIHDVNLRNDPSTAEPPLRLLSKGERLVITGKRTSGFWRVETAIGEKGWVWSRNVEILAGTISNYGISVNELVGVLGHELSHGLSGYSDDPRYQESLDRYITSMANETNLLQATVDHLQLGKVAFSEVNKMVTGEEKTIAISIGHTLDADVRKSIERFGRYKAEDLKVSPFMKVSMPKTDAFDTRCIGTEEQLVTNTEASNWQFLVTPLQSGTHTLHITVSAILRAPGNKDISKDLLVKEIEVTVKISPINAAKYYISQNWQWLWTSIVIPVSIWGWHRRKRRNTVQIGFGRSRNS